MQCTYVQWRFVAAGCVFVCSRFMLISSVFNVVFITNLILQYSSLIVDYNDARHYSKCAVLESYFGSFCGHRCTYCTLCITPPPLTLMVTSFDQADDAGISTYSRIVSLRPRPKSTVPLPPPLVCNRLRTLGLWAPCRLLGSRPLELRFVYRRGCRAGRCVQRARPSPSSADHCLRSSLHGRFSYSELLTSDHCSTNLTTSLRYVVTSTSTFCV